MSIELTTELNFSFDSNVNLEPSLESEIPLQNDENDEKVVNNRDFLKQEIALLLNNTQYDKLEEVYHYLTDKEPDAKDIYEIYCDGAFSEQNKVAASGFVIIKQKITILEHVEVFTELTENMSDSSDAEFYALRLAFDWVENTRFTGSFYIYTDVKQHVFQYDTVNEQLVTKMFDSNPLYDSLPKRKDKMLYLLKVKENIPFLRKENKKVKLRYVKAHSGIYGNMRVDSLCRTRAKQAYKQKIQNLLQQ